MRVPVDDLAEQPDGLLRRELVVEDLQEQPGLLAPFDAGVEMVGVDCERDAVDGPFQPGIEKAPAVEFARNPDLLHRVRLPNPVRREAVYLEHRVADLDAAPIAREHVGLPIDDCWSGFRGLRSILENVQEVVAVDPAWRCAGGFPPSSVLRIARDRPRTGARGY